MDYVVRPLPDVTARLASVERWIQDDFQQILSLLAINPYPNPQFPLITEDAAEDGISVFTYSDDYFPYAIHFVVFEPAADNYGLISVIALTPIRPASSRGRSRPLTHRIHPHRISDALERVLAAVLEHHTR